MELPLPNSMRPNAGRQTAALAACVAAVLLLGWRVADGVTFLAFMDEATHVVGGKVLDAGGVLYRDFVDSHGPFPFMLAQAYGKVFGWTSPTARG